MATTKGERTGFRGAARRWGALCAVCALIALFAVADHRVKRAGDGLGFHPSGAGCVVVSQNFPSFCARVAATDAAARFTEETPRPFDAFELAVRKATGIRPTPLRWRVWLGPRFVWAHWEDTHGLCAHPGLLLRGVHALRTVFGARADANGLYTFAGYYYAWRDGFLIVSPDSEYVKQSLDAVLVKMPPEAGSRDLHVQWADGTFWISPEEDLPIAGRLDVILESSTTMLNITEAWPNTALASITTHTHEDALALWKTVANVLETSHLYSEAASVASALWQHWALDPLEPDWDQDVAEFSAALLDVDVSGTLPIPDWGVMFAATAENASSTHPWAPAIAPLSPIEYAWDNRPGLVATLLGERFAVCLARDNDRWLATSREPLMSNLLGAGHAADAVAADAVLEVNWQTVGERAERMLRRLGELELIPEMSAREVDVYLGKYARSFARMGRLRLEARAQETGLAFAGTLVSPEEEGDDRP